ncbi:flagellar hook-associated protein FlgL [Paenibacillus guangzhouensis]|uniref:flagellar hook-associated protein FlgL n=1 Tax=Paenibacillus guangzhouensis TaxID=1473112 RepID=UPI0012676E36|nr:flagellar hook-associated protein FlgL [Paenibacillus guangzhouensis]
MSIRVTQGMMTNQLMRNVTKNYNNMNKYQENLSTGRKINKPSDDPVGITYALRYRSELTMNEQYQKNMDSAKSFVEHTDTIMGQINDVLQRASELTVKGVTGTNPQSALDAISAEMGGIFDTLLVLGNDQMNGKFIFNGQKTDQMPYSTGGESTDTQKVNFQSAAGVIIPINITGNEVFGENTDQDNMFTIIKSLQTAFKNGDQSTAVSLMDKLQSRMDKFLDMRSEVGARSNRIDLMDSRLKDLSLNLTDLSSKTEDADMAETIIKLQSQESIYQASLSSGAKIIQPSLLDYLR